MNRKSDIVILICALLIILFVIIGASYAYFTANMSVGDETTSIEVKGGRMTIYYDGGDDINLSNIIPDNNPATTKTFTVTGFNNTEIEMGYKISLVVEENTFSEDTLKYKLIASNTDDNGNTIPSITELIDISSGASTIEFGIGSFDAPTDGDKTHTYNLEIYFLNQDYNQNEEQNKHIKAYIKTENYIDPCAGGKCLGDKILAQGGGAAAIEAKGTPDFSVINGESGLYAADDNYGTSYYYRGLKTELNNNLIWGGFQWKIVRINGDGSIRLVYNGTEAQFNSSGSVNTTGADTQIGTSAFNLAQIDAKYVGYMYGGQYGYYSVSRSGAVKNETNSNIKSYLDSWYSTNISGKLFESQVINNLFCNDRQLRSEVGGAATGAGYERIDTYYAAHYRIETDKIPTLECGRKNDCFTTSADIEKGNGNLTKSIGLLTADEASMAGLLQETNNSTNYLYTNQTWWTLSPYRMIGGGFAQVWSINHTGSLFGNQLYVPYGVRPVISISEMTIVEGIGSETNPFVAY